MTYFERGTREYAEVTRILGDRRFQILDNSARQISGRWLKASQIIMGADGKPQLHPERRDELLTKTVRIRIPRRSFLAGRTRWERGIQTRPQRFRGNYEPYSGPSDAAPGDYWHEYGHQVAYWDKRVGPQVFGYIATPNS